MNIQRIERIFTTLGTVAEEVPRIGNVQMAAAIVLKNEIISIGIAERKTHPLQNKYKKCIDAIYLHAEINAIRKCIRILNTENLSKCSLFIARIKKYDKIPHILGWGLAKPCSGCLQAIEAFNFMNVYYTLDHKELSWEVLER